MTGPLFQNAPRLSLRPPGLTTLILIADQDAEPHEKKKKKKRGDKDEGPCQAGQRDLSKLAF